MTYHIYLEIMPFFLVKNECGNDDTFTNYFVNSVYGNGIDWIVDMV